MAFISTVFKLFRLRFSKKNKTAIALNRSNGGYFVEIMLIILFQ